MMRALYAEGLHPEHDGAFLVLHVHPVDSELEKRIAGLGDSAYEGDGAFHLLTSEVGFVVNGSRLELHSPGGALLDIEIEGPSSEAPGVVLMVTHAPLDSLSGGENWPIVIGPWAPAE